LSVGNGNSEIKLVPGRASPIRVFKCQPAGDVSVLDFDVHGFGRLFAVEVGGPSLTTVENLPHWTHIFNSTGCEKGCFFDREESPTNISVVRGPMEVCSVRVPGDVTSLDISGGLRFLDIAGQAIERVEVRKPSPHVCAECRVKTGPGGAIYSGTEDTAAPASAKITPDGHVFTDPHRRIFDAVRDVAVNELLHGVLKHDADIMSAMGITAPKAPPKAPEAKAPEAAAGKPAAKRK
jgi:hypothetical protein